MSFFCVALFRLFVSKFRYFELRVASFRHFAWRFFVISSFCVASFRYFVFSRGFFSLLRYFALRYFVISSFCVALFRYFDWRYYVAKRRKDEMAQISHYIMRLTSHYLPCIQHENQNGVAYCCRALTRILRQPPIFKVTELQYP